MTMLEIDARRGVPADVVRHLMDGTVVVLRQVPGVLAVRQAIEAFVAADVGDGPEGAGRSERSADELAAFYRHGRVPGLDTLERLSHAIKWVRSNRLVSECLAPLVRQLGFAPPVRLDGGIPRLVLPAEVVAQARATARFAPGDFKRSSPDGLTEVFMPGPANIHRDYNRTHYLFQCNLWFPLHDAAADQVLRIYPGHYRQPLHDRDATAQHLAALGPPLSYALAFGDAVLFHGEHLHTSPAGTDRAGALRRHSYDLRIASHCHDDTRHYRQGFMDLRNFGDGRPAAPPGSVSQALARWADAPQGATHPALADPTTIDAVFEQAAFCEDRYLLLAELLGPANRGAAVQALSKVVRRSDQPFWLRQAGLLLLQLGAPALAEQALRSAYGFAMTAPAPRNFAPIDYLQPCTQWLPDRIAQDCAARLGMLQAAAT
jgi:hypothetical protein